MSKIATLMQQAAAGAVGEALAIEDVFSTYLYTGNGVSNADFVINNGIDLQSEGGLVWVKRRDVAENHALTHTGQSLNVNGFYPYLQSQSTGASSANDAYGINAFTNTGFTLRGRSGPTDNEFNSVNSKMASWTFRKAPRFFDVVTYTGDGTTDHSHVINHNLGCEIGMVVTKNTSSATYGDWIVDHRSFADVNGGLYLNATNAQFTNNNIKNLTSTSFSVGLDRNNQLGVTYVAYLFAHDPLGPSGDGSDGLIACGSFNNGATGNVTIDLGWEPQWVMYKRTDGAGNWLIVDTMRGLFADAAPNPLIANDSFAEPVGSPQSFVTSTGFKVSGSANQNFIYIAIRRGPMRQPTSGTEVFAVDQGDGSSVPAFNAGFPVDFALLRRPATSEDNRVAARLTGNGFMATNLTSAEDTSNTNYKFDYQQGFFAAALSSDYYSWMFRRAPGFFDVVAYTGTSTSTVYPHNLNAVPELVIIKNRTGVTNWKVWHKDFGTTYELNLNSSNAVGGQGWINTLPTSENITIGVAGIETNTSGYNYIAYLFATLPGISKVGSYTGNGSSQTIDCGFTSGARFVLIKRTDSTGNWFVLDTARGIVAGDDPYLSLNTTNAEQSDPLMAPNSSGFTLDTGTLNGSGASYIFLAIA